MLESEMYSVHFIHSIPRYNEYGRLVEGDKIQNHKNAGILSGIC